MNKNYYDDDYTESNRDRVLNPRGDKGHWCLCDRTHVRDNERCSVCGRKNGRYRFKP